MRNILIAASLIASATVCAEPTKDPRGFMIYNSTQGSEVAAATCQSYNSQKEFYANTNRIRASAGASAIPWSGEPYLRTWLLGYLSAVNQEQMPDYLAKTNGNEVMAFVDGYCQKNTNRRMRDAADAFWADLMKRNP